MKFVSTFNARLKVNMFDLKKMQDYKELPDYRRVHILLHPNDDEKLEKIKKASNIKKDATMVRALINMAYEELINSKEAKL
ncbi:MAG: hypothetical protein KIT33_15820 [Candidatus Kapabacteria bacterium]|nr:hypothetical protein [Ignavibacteriota bacterium]MCW5886439.1 hypothetical protein [Candidatus Kapabacteria bacterium]